MASSSCTYSPSLLLVVAAVSQLLLLQVSRCSARVSAIIVFGDSSVDSGNNNVISTILKSNFEPYGRDFFNGRPTGRFSNGRIPPDFISEAFGLRPFVPAYLDPAYNISDFATGVCFASAGTGYDTETSNVLVRNPNQPSLHSLHKFIICLVRTQTNSRCISRFPLLYVHEIRNSRPYLKTVIIF